MDGIEYTLTTSEDCSGPCDRCHRDQPLFSFPTSAGDEYLCDCCHDVALETLRPTPAIRICRAHFPPEALELQDHAIEREEEEIEAGYAFPFPPYDDDRIVTPVVFNGERGCWACGRHAFTAKGKIGDGRVKDLCRACHEPID